MRSLEKLLARDDLLDWPTHGPSIDNPKPFVQAFIAHRRERSAAIVQRIAEGDETIDAIVRSVYVGLDPRLFGAAGHRYSPILSNWWKPVTSRATTPRALTALSPAPLRFGRKAS